MSLPPRFASGQHGGRGSDALWEAVSVGRDGGGGCSGWMPAGKGAQDPLALTKSRFPAAGAGRLLAGFCGERTAVLFSDTRGDPCLGFPGAGGLFGRRMDRVVHPS